MFKEDLQQMIIDYQIVTKLKQKQQLTLERAAFTRIS